MRIEFDPKKNETNRRKHGVYLALAEALDWDRLLVRFDSRHEYGEDRYIGIGPIGSRLYVIIFTERGETIRVISLRKATRHEAALYEEANQTN